MNPRFADPKEYSRWLKPQLPDEWNAWFPYLTPSSSRNWIVAVKYATSYRLWTDDRTGMFWVLQGPRATTPAAAIAAWEMTR